MRKLMLFGLALAVVFTLNAPLIYAQQQGDTQQAQAQGMHAHHAMAGGSGGCPQMAKNGGCPMMAQNGGMRKCMGGKGMADCPAMAKGAAQCPNAADCPMHAQMMKDMQNSDAAKAPAEKAPANNQ